MKVLCKKNNAKGFDLKEVTTLLADEYRYSLTIEREYTVMGMYINKKSSCVYYLLDDDYGRPDWFPYLLFEITSHALPLDWYVNVYKKHSEETIFFLSGFYELCNEENYFNQLANRDEKAIAVYFQRKALQKENYDQFIYFKNNIIS